MKNYFDYKELISRYIDGETTAKESDAVERILIEIPSANKYYQELKRLDQLLDERPCEDVSPDWEQNVASSLCEVNVKEEEKMKPKKRWNLTVGSGVAVALVIVSLLSIQVYVQRGLQGRVRQSADSITGRFKMGNSGDDIGDQFSAGDLNVRAKVSRDNVGVQYEPYYLDSNYSIAREAQVYSSQAWNTEEYAFIRENGFLNVGDQPRSTFSIDVDTGSYSNIRRFLNQGQLPPQDAVRIEELINYFSYDYPSPTGDDPFSIQMDVARCPWNASHQLVRIGLRGKTFKQGEIPPSNLVFLVDVSGSMDSANKLPLVKKSLKMMVNQLSDQQRVAIVVYSDHARMVLNSTPGSEKRTILNAIERLQAGGSTAGGAGIQLAYKMAQENYIDGGNNRVILVTDGDFNTGVSSTAEMIRLIEKKRKEGVFLHILGYGTGNLKDHRLEQIANKGNGLYSYVDSEREARKVFAEELGSTLFTIAKDVKIQVEFNPAQVQAYRLIGYENRALENQDFNDEQKDAGELGAGHTVTALYEIIPAGSDEVGSRVDPLVYQKKQSIPSNDLMTVKLRYKDPDGTKSKLIQKSILKGELLEDPRGDFQFAAAVAEFGLTLRNSSFKGAASYAHVLESARASLGQDRSGYRAEFIQLVQKAQMLDQRAPEMDEEGISSGGLRFKNEATDD